VCFARGWSPCISTSSTNESIVERIELQNCLLEHGGIRLIADALLGNSTMDSWNITQNCFSSACLADIERLLESTQLKKITLWGNHGLFKDEGATNTLSRR
jgi:hypothetical protein